MRITEVFFFMMFKTHRSYTVDDAHLIGGLQINSDDLGMLKVSWNLEHGNFHSSPSSGITESSHSVSHTHTHTQFCFVPSLLALTFASECSAHLWVGPHGEWCSEKMTPTPERLLYLVPAVLRRSCHAWSRYRTFFPCTYGSLLENLEQIN